MHYGVGATTATEQAAIQVPKAVLHPANAGDAAIMAPAIKIGRIEKNQLAIDFEQIYLALCQKLRPLHRSKPQLDQHNLCILKL